MTSDHKLDMHPMSSPVREYTCPLRNVGGVYSDFTGVTGLTTSCFGLAGRKIGNSLCGSCTTGFGGCVSIQMWDASDQAPWLILSYTGSKGSVAKSSLSS